MNCSTTVLTPSADVDFIESSPLMVLSTVLDFDLDNIRPGWIVLLAGLLVLALAVVRARWRKPKRPPAGKAPARVSAKPMQEVA